MLRKAIRLGASPSRTLIDVQAKDPHGGNIMRHDAIRRLVDHARRDKARSSRRHDVSSSRLALILLVLGAVSGASEVKAQCDDPPASEVRLRPYSAYAMGAGLDGDEHVVTMVLLHDSEVDAEANIERLDERLRVTTLPSGGAWSELYPSWSISSEGRFLVAEFRGTTLFWAAPLMGLPLLLDE